MTIAAYDRFTSRGIARIAVQRAKQIETECRAVQPEPAQVTEKIVPLVPSRARQLMRKHLMPHWVQNIVMAAAELHRVPPAAIVGRSRHRVIVAARNEAWYQIKLTASPVTGEIPSYPTIGKWFGRDHTTVLYGVFRHAFDNGFPAPSGIDPKRMILRRRATSAQCMRRSREEAREER